MDHVVWIQLAEREPVTFNIPTIAINYSLWIHDPFRPGEWSARQVGAEGILFKNNNALSYLLKPRQPKILNRQEQPGDRQSLKIITIAPHHTAIGIWNRM